MFQGVTKRMKISRRVVANDGTAKKEEKVLTINVKPGWKSGTKITFQREGDQAPNKIPADIVFIIRDKPHQHFKREGPDLRHTCKITLKEVISFCHCLRDTLLIHSWVKLNPSSKITLDNIIHNISVFLVFHLLICLFISGPMWCSGRHTNSYRRENPNQPRKWSDQAHNSQENHRLWPTSS